MSVDGCVNGPIVSDAGAVLDRLHAQTVTIDELTVHIFLSLLHAQESFYFCVSGSQQVAPEES